jgi:hypothetical protein
MGNSPQFRDIINYIATAGVIGLMMSLSMICLCPLISEKLGCNRRVLYNHESRLDRESFSTSDNEIITKNELNPPAVVIATYIQENIQTRDLSELPIAQDVSPV